MDSTDMELECDGSCETSKIVRDEDTDGKRKIIDVDLDSYGREDVPNPPKIRKNVRMSNNQWFGTTLRGLKGSSEIDIYLLEANVRTEGDFDILQWWKMNSDQFEVLGHMARDILAIPVSTVASESAFSTGGHVVDSSRCSLAPKTVEAFICTQNWLNSDPIHLQFQHELEEASKFEEGFRVIMENEKEFQDLPDFDKLSITD
ncbi:uncharacterized protein LOC107990917 [Cucumis melo]|uniref:Uncharacterized protein LOC107990917 n=1 Tax=Cucumis melo TaxID=3656 RepID=A0ABM3L8E1_CUCME|nr:uncharacterized protein LOC107990917 [Cucumis melo]